MWGVRIAPILAAAGVVVALSGCDPVDGAQPGGGTSGATYVALGDSYSTGLGTKGSDPAKCHQSATSYPALIAEETGWTYTNVACPGAISWTLTGTQLYAVSDKTDQVTVTIGGNDVLFHMVLTGCPGGAAMCDARIASGRDYIAKTMPGTLKTVYGAIRRAAPKAKVTVLGYPQVFGKDPSCLAPGYPVTAQAAAAANKVFLELDAAIAKAAKAARFTFVPVDKAFAGHGTCTKTPWIHGFDPAFPAELLHPNTAGHRAYAKAALKVLAPAKTDGDKAAGKS